MARGGGGLSSREPALGRVASDIRSTTCCHVYCALLATASSCGYVLSGAFIFAGLLAYISGSPFVFIELFDVPPERYGLYFGINAIGIMTASQINRWLVGRVEPHGSSASCSWWR